ncbi:hypothetical protein RHMOL_Rhmol09G0146400 [Rhododendron molle]|uniref:Uncharacterized protein n=1 Tax=Rhododendron molle TaxID=49168 RepID=A0ACC0MEJ5_RHOML|nr:hypothetical protein RHMOL_Rhmol09G0146400 [Rhododendron molle]
MRYSILFWVRRFTGRGPSHAFFFLSFFVFPDPPTCVGFPIPTQDWRDPGILQGESPAGRAAPLKRRRFRAQRGKPIKAQNDVVWPFKTQNPSSHDGAFSEEKRLTVNTMKLSRDGLLSPPSTSATCGSGEKPTNATIHTCRPTKILSVSKRNAPEDDTKRSAQRPDLKAITKASQT